MEERDVSDGVPGLSSPLLEFCLWVAGLVTCPFTWQIQLIQSDLLRCNQYCLAGDGGGGGGGWLLFAVQGFCPFRKPARHRLLLADAYAGVNWGFLNHTNARGRLC